MTNEKIREALAGKEKTPEVEAVLAVIDGCVEACRLAAEIKGLGTIERSEACGGASFLRGLKKELLEGWLPPLPAA